MKSKDKNEKTNKKQVVEAEIVDKKKDKKVEEKISKKKDKKQESKVKNSKKSNFFADVINELKKVKWPDKKYMIKYSIATFGTIILTCAYFSLVTAIFALIKKGIIG